MSIDVNRCTCPKGCRNCGVPQAQMGNCPAWDPCPLGADVQPGCPEHDRALTTPAPTDPRRAKPTEESQCHE